METCAANRYSKPGKGSSIYLPSSIHRTGSRVRAADFWDRDASRNWDRSNNGSNWCRGGHSPAQRRNSDRNCTAPGAFLNRGMDEGCDATWDHFTRLGSRGLKRGRCVDPQNQRFTASRVGPLMGHCAFEIETVTRVQAELLVAQENLQLAFENVEKFLAHMG